MENVRQVFAPIVAEHIRENILYLYVSFLSQFSIKIVSQKMVILSSVSQKLVSGFFPNGQFYDRHTKILLYPMLPHLHSLTLSHSLSLSLTLSHSLSLSLTLSHSLSLSCCLPISPSFCLSINIMRVCILDH